VAVALVHTAAAAGGAAGGQVEGGDAGVLEEAEEAGGAEGADDADGLVAELGGVGGPACFVYCMIGLVCTVVIAGTTII
jgi:hypothetical protein